MQSEFVYKTLQNAVKSAICLLYRGHSGSILCCSYEPMEFLGGVRVWPLLWNSFKFLICSAALQAQYIP